MHKKKPCKKTSWECFKRVCMMFLCLHYSLYSLVWKKYRKVQNLGAVKVCPPLGCMYDVFVFSLLLYSLVRKKYGKVQNLGAVEFCLFLGFMYNIFASSPFLIWYSAKNVKESAISWSSWGLSSFRLLGQGFYVFTTPYTVFSEKSTEKCKFLGQLSFVNF